MSADDPTVRPVIVERYTRTYIAGPIPTPGPPSHDAWMSNLAVAQARPSPSTSRANPADLLRWAHRLSDSAEAISSAAASPGAAPAIAAALAHIETALEMLERGAEEMETLARARLARATVMLGDPWNDDVVARTGRDFEDLARALANARRACEKVRRSAGPILAELTAV